MRALRTLAFCVVFAALCTAARASAHPMDTSAIYLDLSTYEITGEIQVHIEHLELALGRPIASSSGVLARGEESALAQYFGAHARITNDERVVLPLHVLGVKMIRIHGANHISARLSSRPTPNTSLDTLVLHYDAIVHRIPVHKVIVLLGNDEERGIHNVEAQSIGTLSQQDIDVVIDRGQVTAGRSFWALFALGARHIAEGVDHLLFLLLLLLPAPFVARQRRWAERRSLRDTLVHILTIVTAFTVGHSITLAAGVLGAVQLPSQPVEVTISVSILLSAIHAGVPLFPRREALLAGTFGLVHGLAFSTVLAELGLHGSNLAVGLFAFNLGIEVMQLAVVAFVAPCFVLVGRSQAAVPLRLAGAGIGCALALMWIAERAWA